MINLPEKVQKKNEIYKVNYTNNCMFKKEEYIQRKKPSSRRLFFQGISLFFKVQKRLCCCFDFECKGTAFF